MVAHGAWLVRLCGGVYDAAVTRLGVFIFLLAPLLVACGVRFSAAKQGNDFFKTLTVSGDRRAGSALTASVTYMQKAPFEVKMTCELRKNKTLVRAIGNDVIPRYPFGNPKATPFPGNFSYDFTVDEPGTYEVQCYTPVDEDNFIVKEFTVRPASTPTPGS